MATPSHVVEDEVDVAQDARLRALAAVGAPTARPAAAAARPLPSAHVGRWFVACDLGFAVLTYVLTLGLRSDAGDLGFAELAVTHADWSMVGVLAIGFVVFYSLGLYSRELLALRALHLLTLAKAMLWTVTGAAVLMYVTQLDMNFDSRLGVVVIGSALFLCAALLRVLVLSRLLAPRFRAEMGETLVVGWPYRTETLRERLQMLRGFSKVTLVETVSTGPVLARAEAQLARRDKDGRPVYGTFFIDAGSLSLQQSLALIRIGWTAGVSIYVASNMLRPIAARRLLIDLFEGPVVRVRRSPGSQFHAPGKRVLDIAAASVALVLLSPVMFGIALAVKFTSPGPVLFAQERVGRRGRRFKFYKFRSMVTDADESIHSEYMRAVINGDADPQKQKVDGEVSEVYKLIDDPRITRVGRVLRRYSIDELPQLWNVLVGDMSLVGPRPPLPYEVEAYQPWHHRRLAVKPGITGVWQVDGRSRVGFDDMVFQDVMYDCTRDLLVDVALCLRTVPAALLGHGAA